MQTTFDPSSAAMSSRPGPSALTLPPAKAGSPEKYTDPKSTNFWGFQPLVFGFFFVYVNQC